MEQITIEGKRLIGKWIEEHNLRLFEGMTEEGETVRYRPAQLGLEAALIFQDRYIGLP